MIVPRNNETKVQARKRVKTNLSLSIDYLEKAMAPIDVGSDFDEQLRECYDKLDAIYYDEFGD